MHRVHSHTTVIGFICTSSRNYKAHVLIVSAAAPLRHILDDIAIGGIPLRVVSLNECLQTLLYVPRLGLEERALLRDFTDELADRQCLPRLQYADQSSVHHELPVLTGLLQCGFSGFEVAARARERDALRRW